MKSSLFRRLFFAVVGILLVTILSFTGIMCATSAAQQRSAYEAELKLQARDLAQLVQGVEMTSLWRVDPADVSTFQWKITEIQKDYQASVWLVYKSGLRAHTGRQRRLQPAARSCSTTRCAACSPARRYARRAPSPSWARTR